MDCQVPVSRLGTISCCPSSLCKLSPHTILRHQVLAEQLQAVLQSHFLQWIGELHAGPFRMETEARSQQHDIRRRTTM